MPNQNLTGNLIILGCTGFIGRNLIQHFAQKKNYKVYGTYLKRKPWRDKKIKFLKKALREQKF